MHSKYLAPLYGEHNREVLLDYGFDDQEIENFEKDGVIVSPKLGPRERVA